METYNGIGVSYYATMHAESTWTCIMSHDCFNTEERLRISDEGSIPEMRIWFILLLQSDFKMVYLEQEWCSDKAIGL